MKHHLRKIFNPRTSSAGFTLIELLVAASITTVVVAVGGYGLVSIMSADRTASAQTDRRMEQNRALDFIADEVRQARSINRIAAPVASRPSTAIVEAGTVQSILVLELPNVSAGPVVYSVAQPKSSSVWQGPRAIYRWGPNLANNGSYTDPNDTSEWENKPLVDLVEDAKPNPNPACTNIWFPEPDTGDRRGFYACVDPAHRVAELHLLGRVTKAYGGPTTPYKVSSKVFARANGGGSDSSLVKFDTPGVLTPTSPITLNFKVIGGSVTCGIGGAVLPTTTSVSIDNGSTWTSANGNEPLSLEPGTTNRVLVRGNLTTNSCGNINNTFISTDTRQVKALRNGDSVPSVPAFGNQTTIDTYLQAFIDPATNRISLADNEVIYLYEMGSTNTAEASFDLQDIVVLATAEPR